MSTHTQCKLRKGSEFQTSWIESKYASIGRKIGLKEAGVWDEGWMVVEIHDTMPTKSVMTMAQEAREKRRVLGRV